MKAPHKIYIGDNFFIGKDFLLGVFDPEKGKIEIGNNVGCQQRVRISAMNSVKIGNNVLIGSDVFITDNNHGTNAADPLPYGLQPITFKEVEIGDDCWIGEKVIILPGAHIGKKVVIAAGSVVNTDIPDYCMAAGVPAKVVRKWNFETDSWEK